MPDISVRADVAAISRKLSMLAHQQLPFATARAVTELAKLAAKAEKAAMPEVFDKPVPFTVNSVAVQAAKKAYPSARVYIRDKAALYLAPYEFGGVQYLGRKPADLVPVNAAANQYGNLPRSTIKQYMGRPDVFIGTVKTKHGPVFGVWQKPAQFVELKFGRRKGRPKVVDKALNVSHQMKLLVAYHDPVETKKHLEFGSRAQEVVTANFDRVFGAELAKAVASAK